MQPVVSEKDSPHIRMDGTLTKTQSHQLSTTPGEINITQALDYVDSTNFYKAVRFLFFFKKTWNRII